MKADGFTLIELLITLAILGIIAATAIPQYSDYKKKAFDTRARADLINIAIAEEAYFLDSETYLSCSNATCTQLPGIAAISKGVNVSITATPLNFTGTATHSQGSGQIFNYDSDQGGLLN